jgi:leader peptidase (prepilin peptidase)/N-methyltransferase
VTLYGAPLWIILIWLFLLGATLGSFLNVCIYRIPQHETFWEQLRGLGHPPSHCPRCGHRIPPADNLPIIGWLKLGGRCRFCRGKISPRYPLIELFNGLLFVVVYWFEIPAEFGATVADSSLYSRLGPQIVGGWSDATWLHWRYAYHMVLLESLVVATFIDFDLRIIPDGATLPAMTVGVIGAAAIGQVFLVPVWFQQPETLRTILFALSEFFAIPQWMHALFAGPEFPAWIKEHPHLHGLAVSLAGLVVGGGIVWAVRIIGQWGLGQEAMGFGDVILMATIGSFLGWQPTIAVFLLAPVFALVVVAVAWVFRRDREIPYGPYLSLATLVLLLGWKSIWPPIERYYLIIGPLLPVYAFIMAVLLAASLLFMRSAKRLMGIPLLGDEVYDEWTSADQLAYQAGENSDSQSGSCRDGQWPGTAAARGTNFADQWRHGSTSAWQQRWQRRH